MRKLKFKIEINAPKEKVWETLWNKPTYNQWTAIFSEGSHAEGDWNEGSKMKFLSANGEGMYSLIEKKVINEQMIIKHLGEIKNGEELDSEWAGAIESYILNEKDGGTELNAEMDSTEEYEQFFEGTFPKALEKIKQLAEN